MGGSVSFTANVDSPSKAGAKSVMSDTIDGLSAEQLLAGIEKYIRAGKTASGYEAQVEVSDKDGGVLVSQRFDIPSIFGGGSSSVHTWYYFDAETQMVEAQFYANQAGFERGEPSTTGWIKVHHSPVKVEFWVDVHEVRSSGLVMKLMMDKLISEMGSRASSLAHQPGIDDSNKLSVVSEPIEGASVSPESFLEFFRGFLIDTMGATELPDGSIMEERSAVLGISSRSYVRHVMKNDEGRVLCYEFGEDESLEDLFSVTHCKAHSEPFRLEMWNVSKLGRRAGDGEAKVIDALLQGVLKAMQAEG